MYFLEVRHNDEGSFSRGNRENSTLRVECWGKMDREVLEALTSAQQGNEMLAEMVVKLEGELKQSQEAAATSLDNSALAEQLRRAEAKVAELESERDLLIESYGREKASFSQTVQELKAQCDI